MRRGRWDRAAGELRALIDGVEDPGMLISYSVPWLGRVLARQGDPEAAAMLVGAWEQARRQRLLLGVAYAGIALVEWAWLAGEPDTAAEVADELLPRMQHRGAAHFRAELLRHLARAGLPAEPFDGCPEPWASGLRGDWRAAADGWAAEGDPYEQALELAVLRRARARRSRACGSSTGSAPRPPRRSPAGGWRRSARASRGRAARPAPTRPGSPTASSPCSRCSATGSPTRRSPSASWSPCGPSTTTSPRC